MHHVLSMILILATAGAAWADPPLSLLGTAAQTPDAGITADARSDGMTRLEAKPGTVIRTPRAGMLSVREPSGILELTCDDGTVISWMSLGTHVAPGPLKVGDTVGTVGAIGFCTVLAQAPVAEPAADAAAGKKERPDWTKPGFLMPYDGGVAYVQITSVQVKVAQGHTDARRAGGSK